MKSLIIHTDGGARGNPGPAAIGAVIKTETGQILCELSRRIGESTNNVAEYKAVVSALTWLSENKKSFTGQANDITVFMDSTLVVNQLNGLFRVKDATLRV